MKTFEKFNEQDPFGEEVGARNIPPQPIEPEHIDHRLLFGLQKIAIDYVNKSYRGEEPDEDDAQEALDQVVKVFYGIDIFEKLRELEALKKWIEPEEKGWTKWGKTL